MLLRLFGAVQNYAQMLRKIALFTFLTACLAIALLRSQIPGLEKVLSPYSATVPVANLLIPFGTLVPALAIALVFRICKLHDQLSDLFGVREHFDVKHILVPIATEAGVQQDRIVPETLAKMRGDLMAKVFYRYASSTPERAVIDTHYVTMALDQWSWFWIILEALPLILVAAVVLFVTKNPWPAVWLLVLSSLMALLLLPIWKGCQKYAKQEVEQIVGDPERRARIAGVFDALPG